MFKKLKSFAKINLYLRVGKKIKSSRLHNIQSLVCLINLFDEITIKTNKNKKDNIKFYGKFSKHIFKKDTVTNSISILKQKGIIDKNINYNILIKKNIPVFSGLGGGSSNAAFLIKNLVNKEKLNNTNISLFSRKIGSDIKLFFKTTQIFQKNISQISNIKSKLKLYFIIIYPFLKSSTKEIYSKFKPTKGIKKNTIYQNASKKKIVQNLLKEENDLEKIIVSKFPIIKKILFELSLLNKCQFSRPTGSGSACFGVFLTKKSADLGLKKIKKKFPKFWCVVGKTI